VARLLIVHVTDLDSLFIANLLGLIQADLLSLIPAHLARHVVADLDRHQLLHNLGDILALLFRNISADLLADCVALFGVLVAGDLSVLADLLRNLSFHSVLDIATLLPWHIPAVVHKNSIALLLRMSGTGSLRNLPALLLWHIPANINEDDIALLLCDRTALCPWHSLALLARHWPAVVDQDSLALLFYSGCAGSAGDITTLERWLILIFLGDVTAAFFSDGGAVFVSNILAVLLRLLVANLVHHSFAFSFLDSVADLGSDILAIILRLLLTDLPRGSLTLVHLHCRTHLFRNILAILLWDRGAYPVSDSVADITGHDVHHGPLLRATVLHGAHHRGLDSLADDFRNIRTLLVVDRVTLGLGYGVTLSLVLDATHFVELGLTHGNSLVMADGLQLSVALGLVLRVALLGWDDSLRGVVALLDHGIGTNVLGDSGAFLTVSDV